VGRLVAAALSLAPLGVLVSLGSAVPAVWVSVGTAVADSTQDTAAMALLRADGWPPVEIAHMDLPRIGADICGALAAGQSGQSVTNMWATKVDGNAAIFVIDIEAAYCRQYIDGSMTPRA